GRTAGARVARGVGDREREAGAGGERRGERRELEIGSDPRRARGRVVAFLGLDESVRVVGLRVQVPRARGKARGKRDRGGGSAARTGGEAGNAARADACG